MNFPVAFQIGSFTISLHAILETAAFFIGFRYFLYLRKQKGDLYTDSTRTSIIIGAIFGALLGSRLVGALERPNELLDASNTLAYIYNNKTVVGGFLGGLFGVELTKKFIGENKSSGDLFVYPIIIALIVGRIGCFSMGIYEETYGNPTEMPWGMDLGDGISRHPVTLYEILFLIIFFILLKRSEKNNLFRQGALFKMFMIGYLFFRLMLDFIKPNVMIAMGMSTIQLTCLAGLLYYSRYIIQPKKLTSYA